MKLGFASKKELLGSVYESAHRFEQIYHGCTQCALAALMDTFPEIHNPGAFKAASGLGGGVGLSGEGSCGGLTGGVLAVGLFFGREIDSFDDPEGNRFTSYRVARRLADRFKEEYGSLICKDIQTQVLGRPYRLYDPEEFNAFVKAGGHSTECPKVVGLSARWTAEIMLDELEASGTITEFSPARK